MNNEYKIVDGIITLHASKENQEIQKAMLAVKPVDSSYKESLATAKKRFENAPDQKFPEIKTRHKLNVGIIDNTEVYTIENEGYDKILIYIHGGAWVYGMYAEQIPFIEDLVDEINAKAYMPLYPLAPMKTHKECNQIILDLYEELLKENKPIIVMGDSAGGTITLSLVYLLKKQGKKLPDKIIPLSPCVDLTFSNPKMYEIEPIDPIIGCLGCRQCAEMWAGDTELTDPEISALYSDVSGYPETLMFIGTHDTLYPDEYKFYKKLKEAGVKTTLVYGEGLPHVFCNYEGTPEYNLSIRIIKDFLSK